MSFLCMYSTLFSAFAVALLCGNAFAAISVDDGFDKDEMTLNLLDKYDTANCLDGTPSGYYFRPGFGDGANHWNIRFRGGGSCGDKYRCLARSKTELGSSLTWEATMNGAGLQSPNPKINPDFHNWNTVFLPYCSGDLHSGQRTEMHEETGLYFQGYWIVQAMIDDLLQNKGLDGGHHVILSGGSAGAIGAIIHANGMYDRLSTIITGNFKVSPNAGWRLGFPSFPGSGVPDVHETMEEAVEMWDSFFVPECAEAHPNARITCFQANVTYPFIRVPMFFVQSRYDSNQLASTGLDPSQLSPEAFKFVKEFGKEMDTSVAIVQHMGRPDGLWLTSCWDHVVEFMQIQVGGMTQAQALGKWFFDPNPTPLIVVDECEGISCNPTCHRPHSKQLLA